MPTGSRRTYQLLTAIVGLAAVLAFAAPARSAGEKSAAAGDGKSVEDLAREGYWGKPDTWDAHAKLLGRPAPQLELSNWTNGEVRARDMRGRIAVVDFWATWCGPCIRSIPHNNEIAERYADKGVVVIGACGGGQEEKMNEVVKQHDLKYPTARVTPRSTQQWGVHWWPTYAVVDRKGNLRAVGLQPDYVDKVVEALLKEQPPEEKAPAGAKKAGASEKKQKPARPGAR